MIINHNHRFVYIHIPKAGGTSISHVLSRYSRYNDIEVGGTNLGEDIQSEYERRFGLKKHSTSLKIAGVVGRETWDEYFKFSFVRNPFSRLVSAYYFLKRWTALPENFAAEMSKLRTVTEFLESAIWTETSGIDDMFAPQANWLTRDGESGPVLVNFVGRIESFQDDMRRIIDVLKLPPIKSLDVRANKSPQYHDPTMSDRVIELITTRYKIDFELFGYNTSPPINPE